MVETEVAIVGGGPAGSTCARELRRMGVDCIVLDRCDFPRPKLCAGWITPAAFDRLELIDYPHSLVRLERLHCHFRGRPVAVPTVQYSVRRIELDAWLLQRCGVPVHRHAVERIERAGGSFVIDDSFVCRVVVGAGGTYCPVYRTFFKAAHPRDPDAMITTLEEELEYDIMDDRCCLWFFDNGLPGYSWYVPKGDGILNVGIGGVAGGMRCGRASIRDHWTRFARKLEALGLVRGHAWRARGYNYFVRRKPAPVRLGNIFLIGDAAGLATRDLGEGIGPAVESGIRAAEAIARGRPYTARAIRAWSAPFILTAKLRRR